MGGPLCFPASFGFLMHRRLINAAHPWRIMVWTAGAEHVTAKIFVKRVIGVLIKQPGIWLVLGHQRVNLLINGLPLLGVELLPALDKKFVHFGIGVAPIVTLLARSPDVIRGIGISPRSPAPHGRVEIVFLHVLGKNRELQRTHG